MNLAAYALRSEFEDDYAAGTFGGSLAVMDGRTLDVAETLRQGDGRIVLAEADTELVAALDSYPPLKRVALDEATEPTVRRYDFLDVPALHDEAARRNIGRARSGSRDTVVAALVEQDGYLESGDLASATAVAVGQPLDAPVEPEGELTPADAPVEPEGELTPADAPPPAPPTRRRRTGSEA